MSTGDTTKGRRWLARNGWWLVALPVVLVLALASAAYRVNDFWYENGWHREIASVPAGEFVTARHTVYGFDQRPKDVGMRMRVGAVGLTTELRDGLGNARTMPAYARGAKLRLDFQAVDGKPAPYCEVYVIDADGSWYAAEELDAGTNPCPPPGGSPSDRTAPQSWSRLVVAALPKTARPVAVRVGVTRPGYVTFRIGGAEQRALADR